MQLAVMGAAKRYREFVTDLLSKTAGLGKPKVVRVARLSATDKAGMFGHKAQVPAVALPPLLWQGEGIVSVIGT